MKAVTYYLALPFLYGISILPFWLLYRVSDFFFVVLYHLLGYRRKVVRSNLRNSFPEKSEQELSRIERRFYRYLCDLTLETLKSLTISPNTLKKRLKFVDTTVFERYYHEERSIIIAMGHWGNWELGGARFAVEPLHQLFVIYRPLHNPYFEKLIRHMRMRLGNGLYPMKEVLRGMITNRRQVTATAFIADQTPSRHGAHWMEFLNQDTPVFMGTGKIANKMNYPVVYAGVRKVGRGRYQIELEDLIPEPKNLTAEEIVETFTRRLEKDIRELPETWLWSHRRWKHKRRQE